jgi:hypothetical protein
LKGLALYAEVLWSTLVMVRLRLSYCHNNRFNSVIEVQRVYAIGKPSDEGLCAFRDLVNVVVLPSVGKFQSSQYTPFAVL